MHPFRHHVVGILICSFWLGGAVFVDAAGADAEVVKIRVNADKVVCRIPDDFIGFGYETSAVAQSNFFSAQNAPMVRLYRNLSPHGLIRIGGNVSDHTQFQPEGTPAARTERETTIITRSNLVDLAGFARATGWKVMWGLNLATGTREAAVEEAVAVDGALGNNLHSFEIGNEVDAHRGFANNYPGYHTAFLEYKSAMRTALPAAAFSGPDVIGNWNWITNFASTEAGDMRLLTQHYYRGGARDPDCTIEKLLRSDEAFDARLEKLRELCRGNQLGFRINEVNSFSGGGKPGVSDTFASALWALDYMFRLASHGAEGINLETDINQLGFISHYSPIGRDPVGRCIARPEYYGMLAFALSGNGDVLEVTQEKTAVNLSVYATRNPRGELWIIIVNKDASRDAIIETATPPGYAAAAAFRLKASSLESREHVTLAAAEVCSDGKWSPQTSETCPETNGLTTISAPHASAVLARFVERTSAAPKFRVLALTESGGHHVEFTKAAVPWLKKCGEENGFEVDYIHDTKPITKAFLAKYRLVLQLDYVPYGWTPEARETFQDYIENGRGGWVGLHHATLLGEFDRQPMWPWFSEFMGGIRFKNYIPNFTAGTVRVEDRTHPCMKDLPDSFTIAKEEWYTYDRSPRPNVRVLASVDESTYTDAKAVRMGDHPVVWTNERVAARNIYIFMGHGPWLFEDKAYTTLLRNAILWAAQTPPK